MHNYRIYIGGSDYMSTPLFHFHDRNVKDLYDSSPELGKLPMFDSEDKIQNAYNDDAFYFTNENVHTFCIVCSNDKSDVDLATNITIVLVPSEMVTVETDCILGKQSLFGHERGILLHNTGLTYSTDTTSNTNFVKGLFRKLRDRMETISNVLCHNEVNFEMVPIDRDKGKLKPLKHITQPISVGLKHKHKGSSKGFYIRHSLEKSVVARGLFTKPNPRIFSTKNILKQLSILPNHFMDKHFIFNYFNEIELGVKKTKGTERNANNR